MITAALLFLSIACNIVFCYTTFNLLRKTEAMEVFITDCREELAAVIEQMHRIDIRGAFEADDEVGIVFRAMKKTVDSLSRFLTS